MSRWKEVLGAGHPGVFFLSALSVVLLAYVFLIVMPFSLVASSLGPRWVLLANVMLDLFVVASAASLVVASWRWFRTRRNVAFALLVLGVCILAMRDLPAETVDLLIPLDEDALDFSGWRPHGTNSLLLRFEDGREAEFANFVGVEFRSATPGRYLLVRGHFSRLVLDMRPLRP